MKTNISKLAKVVCFSFVAAALIFTPAITRAEDSTNAPAGAGDKAKKRQVTNTPYHGKVVAVDSAAMSFTIGEVYYISSTTKITKDGHPAVFADITVGENVTGTYKKSAEGKFNVNTVYIGGSKKTMQPEAKTHPDKKTDK